MPNYHTPLALMKVSPHNLKKLINTAIEEYEVNEPKAKSYHVLAFIQDQPLTIASYLIDYRGENDYLPAQNEHDLMESFIEYRKVLTQ